jgi:hypothetical protein
VNKEKTVLPINTTVHSLAKASPLNLIFIFIFTFIFIFIFIFIA